MFNTDRDLFNFVSTNLYVAVISDILDTLGHRDRVMHQRLRPLLPEIKKCGFVGRARTLRWMEADYVSEHDPYGLEMEAIDSLRPGDVVVHSTDHAGTNAPWGELMTTAAIKNGAAGCVCDSNVRDCIRIIELGFPVYCAGIKAVDSKGRGIVKEYDVPVRCGDVLVRPGELIVADFDGIVAIPGEMESDVIKLAVKKVDQEDQTRAALQNGRSLRETYEVYGVL